MEFVTKISTTVLEAVAKMELGILVIPAVIIVVLALGLFAKHSYKLFKFALPVAGALIGSYIGAGTLGKMVADAVPALANIIQPYYLIGIVVGLVLALIVGKHVKLTIFLVGAGLGWIIVSEIVKSFLLGIDFVYNLAVSSGLLVTNIVGYIIAALVTILCAVLLKKFFKGIYILVTSIGGTVVAAALGAIFLFNGTSIAEIAVIACAVLGLIFGIRAAAKQFGAIEE